MTENWIHPDRENLTWEVFGEASRNLSEQIVEPTRFHNLVGSLTSSWASPAAASFQPVLSVMPSV